MSKKKEHKKKKCNIKNFLDKIVICINTFHLYTTKSEALFKAAIIAISWSGGVWKQDTPLAYYLFSISIIMEYAIQLVKAKKIIPKLLPIVLIISNLVVLVLSTNQILYNSDTYDFQYWIELITIIIIGADAIITLLIEPPGDKIEASLKAVQTKTNTEE